MIYIYKQHKNKITLKIKLTYLSSYYSGRYAHVRVPGKVDSGIGIVLYHWNLPRPPIKKLVFKGLDSPPSPLSQQHHHPSVYCWRR
jgi:hypothetical protein